MLSSSYVFLLFVVVVDAWHRRMQAGGGDNKHSSCLELFCSADSLSANVLSGSSSLIPYLLRNEGVAQDENDVAFSFPRFFSSFVLVFLGSLRLGVLFSMRPFVLHFRFWLWWMVTMPSIPPL